MATRESRSYRPKQAAELLGIGTATLWRWIRERQDFPKPIRLSPRCTVLDGAELIAWRDAQGKDAK
ncbi:MAG: AlpA family phage regulatory protein [Hydrogenophaga sp.]|nr:AlpA family phage regulatory protein [Hydrogenophaga sp.]